MTGANQRLSKRNCFGKTSLYRLECGGSDAYSGISANPALGAAADLVVEHGGSAIILGTLALPGNLYDGHTAEAVLKQLKRITGPQPEILTADRRYRGEKGYGKTPLLAPSRTSTALILNTKNVNKEKASEKELWHRNHHQSFKTGLSTRQKFSQRLNR